MGVSGYAVINWDSHGVHVVCTDNRMLDPLFVELKRLIPSCSLYKSKIFTGDVYSYHASGLQGKDSEAAFWVLKQICLQGWEPFEASGLSTGYLPLEGFVRLRPTGDQIAGTADE